MSDVDMVAHPPHYSGHPSGVECIELAEALSFNRGNAWKYLFRHRDKGNPLQDIQKARWYVARELARLTKETWAVYPVDDRYEVSTLGQVRNRATGKIRKPVRIKGGYLTLLFSLPGHKPVLRYVHRMVIETFVAEIPDDRQVCHGNGDREVNTLWNLRIDTIKGNASDRRRHDTGNTGDRNGMAKLTAREVEEIRVASTPVADLARTYGVSTSQIQRVRRGENWGATSPTRDDLARAVLLHENGNIGDAMSLIWWAGVRDDPRESLRTALTHLDREIARLEAQ